ncbi:MAG: DUF6580 family putative transport protein [Verrucomicrobiota bacterium]
MHRYLPLGLIIGLLIAFRILGSILPDSQPNFQPLAAVFFCGALLAPGWRGFAIPVGIWAATYLFGKGPYVSDPTIFLTTFGAFAATYFLGKALAERKFPILLAGSILAAVVFHLITNGAAWLFDPMYEKSLTGLWQSLWAGPPGSTIPSWVFLRNLAAANLLFTAIFAGSQLRIPKLAVPSSSPVLSK